MRGRFEYRVESILASLSPEQREAAKVKFSPPLDPTTRAEREAQSSALWTAYDRVSEKRKAAAKFRLTMVRRVRELAPQGAPLKELLALAPVVAKEFGAPSKSKSLKRWIARLDGLLDGAHDDELLPRLLGDHGGGRARDFRYDRLQPVFQSLHLKDDTHPAARPSAERACQIVGAEGTPLPTAKPESIAKNLLRRERRDLPTSAILLGRLGPRRADDLIHPTLRRVRTVFGPGDAYDADGNYLPFLIDFNDGDRPGRGVFLPVADLCSNFLLSWRVSRTENADLYRLAACDAFRVAIPLDFYVDNSRAMSSPALSGGATRYRWRRVDEDILGIFGAVGCRLHFSRPYSGRSKPIERAFRDLCSERIGRHLALAPYFLGPNPNERTERERKAAPLDLVLKIIEEEVDLFNERPGRSTAACGGVKSFRQAFEEGLTSARKLSAAQARLFLLAAKQARVGKDGTIQFLGNRFFAPEVSETLRGVEVVIRFDPQHLHAGIFVYKITGEFVAQAPCLEPVGFNDAAAAREKERLRRRAHRLNRQILQTEAALSNRQLATLLDRSKKLQALPLSSAKVTRLVRPGFAAAQTGSASPIAAPHVEDREARQGPTVRIWGVRSTR